MKKDLIDRLKDQTGFLRILGADELAAMLDEACAAIDVPPSTAWAEGYKAGVDDERTSEANIGVAGFNAKVNPNRQNPYAAMLAAAPQPAQDRCKELADLGWQAIECPACGSSARGYPRPEQPVQEPEAYAVYWGIGKMRRDSVHLEIETAQAVASQIKSATAIKPLYTTPQAQPAQPDRKCSHDYIRTTDGEPWMHCEKCGKDYQSMPQPAQPVQEPYGQVTTHAATGQQFFYRWPDPPYLDNASECVTVYTTQAITKGTT